MKRLSPARTDCNVVRRVLVNFSSAKFNRAPNLMQLRVLQKLHPQMRQIDHMTRRTSPRLHNEEKVQHRAGGFRRAISSVGEEENFRSLIWAHSLETFLETRKFPSGT